MAQPERPRPDEDHRRKDAAFVLPVFGVLLLPPFVNLFTQERLIFGLPLEVVYLFTVWVALVAGALMLSRRVAPPDHGPD
ncbi:MAG: hypothetical protein WCZ72_08460 [Gemmobacter sp.]